jgi:hypothetical protein
MKPRIRLIALSLAVAVNAGAVAALHVAMVDGADQERLSLQEPERIVVTASRERAPERKLAARNCPNPQAL